MRSVEQQLKSWEYFRLEPDEEEEEELETEDFDPPDDWDGTFPGGLLHD